MVGDLGGKLLESHEIAGQDADACGAGLHSVPGLLCDEETGEDVGLGEELLGVAEVDDLLDPGLFGENVAQRLAVASLHPLVGDDEGEPAARPQNLEAPLIEVDVEVGHAVVSRGTSRPGGA